MCVLPAGLDLEKDTILQAAMIITDGQLRKQIKVQPDLQQRICQHMLLKQSKRL